MLNPERPLRLFQVQPVLLPCFFFEKAYEKGGDEGVKRFEKELDILTWTVRKDADWDVVTRSPLVEKKIRNQLVQERLKKLGCSQIFIDCILALIDRRVINRLDQVRVDYEEIMRAYRREVDVSLVTGKPIKTDELEFYKKKHQTQLSQPSRQFDLLPHRRSQYQKWLHR